MAFGDFSTSRATAKVALCVISGFGRARKKKEREDTCKLQVIYTRRKERNNVKDE